MQRVYGTKIRASRFFRWDGKAASAFNSLNRVVNIARLSSRIVDASLRKSANIASALEIGQSSPEWADLSHWEQDTEELLRERLILSAESTAAERRFIFVQCPFGLKISPMSVSFGGKCGHFSWKHDLVARRCSLFLRQVFLYPKIMFLNNGKRTTT